MRRVLAAALLGCAAALAAPTAGAAHCHEDTLLEAAGVTCVYECGSFYPQGVPTVSYCVSNNGRCPGSVDRAPDAPPYFMSCSRDDSAACDPPPAVLRLALCNQT